MTVFAVTADAKPHAAAKEKPAAKTHAAALAPTKAASAAKPPVAVQDDTSSSEAGLDPKLMTAARAQPVKALDGSALNTPASHMLLIDNDTGMVLASKAPDAKMYPSSMTKMLTLYVVFGKLKEGTIKLDTKFHVSEKAWRMQGSKMFVPMGGEVDVENLIRGIAIQSGNDACIVMAEGIAGSEEAFAKQMNDTAEKLGMKGSHFVDASGWPNPEQYTTPSDLARLAAALIHDFPEYYHYFSEREFTYNDIRQMNRDTLLSDRWLGVDGLKTGHTDAAGYGITLSAQGRTSGRRLLLVVNGLDSEKARAEEGERLLLWGFGGFKDVALFKPGQKIVSTKVWLGKTNTVALTVKDLVIITVPKSGKAGTNVQATASYTKQIPAPLTAGQEVGKLTITLPDGSSREVPLVTLNAVERKGAVGRVIAVWRSWLGL